MMTANPNKPPPDEKRAEEGKIFSGRHDHRREQEESADRHLRRAGNDARRGIVRRGKQWHRDEGLEQNVKDEADILQRARDRRHGNQRGDPGKQHESTEDNQPRDARKNLQNGVRDTAFEEPDLQADEEQDSEDEVRVDAGKEGTLLAGS
jgi:hypothetical protein